MRAPSTKTLIALAALFFLASTLHVPEPAVIPVIGPDGSVMHSADGTVLVHLDIARLNKEIIPWEIAIACSVACALWLFIRFLRFLYARWNDNKMVV
jgi:hypothetical protein